MIKSRIAGIFLFFFLMYFTTVGTAADILFQCSFDGPGSNPKEVWENCGSCVASSAMNTYGSIVNEGVNGKCLKYSVNTGGLYAPLDVYGINADPITIVYYERFSKSLISGANIKSVRPYCGSGSGNYLAAMVALHFDNSWYQSAWDNATLIPGDNVTSIKQDSAYCRNNGDGTYNCPVRMSIRWSPGYGTSWRKVRIYIDMPTTNRSADGTVKVWFDDVLTYTLADVDSQDDDECETTWIRFAPSDEANESYDHYYDEIVVYSGYVPPENTSDSGFPNIAIKAPTDSSQYSTDNPIIDIGGTASDDIEVSSVTWTNNRGNSGTAVGTDNWTISNLSLEEGENEIVVIAHDATGQTGSATLTVGYSPAQNTTGGSKVFGDVSGSDYPGSCQDTYISVGARSSNYSNDSQTLNTYTWPTNTSANRVVMKWDLSAIPQNATIHEATLSLNMYSARGDESYEVSAHRIVTNNPNISSCTWNTYDGTHSWTGGTNGGEQDLAPAESTAIVDRTAGYKNCSITQMVQQWVSNPSSNYGLMLDSDSTAASDSNRLFRPTEYSNPDQRPKLTVTYSDSSKISPPENLRLVH